MWEDALSLTQEAWARALEAEGKEYENSVVIAAANALCAARRFNEIFVGGNDTSCLVQLLALGQEESAGDTDVLASVLLPLDDVEVAYTARGQDAYRLLCSFWTWSPTSPALISSKGKYHQLMCKISSQEWTQGTLCPARIATLQAHPFSELQIYVAGEEGAPDAELERAAICRSAL